MRIRYITIKEGKLHCWSCGKGTVKNTEEYASFLCDCGIIIYYYKSRISMFIDKKDYLKSKSVK